MKIEKYKYDNNINCFYNYYVDSQTNYTIYHGLYNSWFGIGYRYHGEHKGFWVRKKY